MCQKVVYRATDPDFDIWKTLPAPINTPEDVRLYITPGLCHASNPAKGEVDVMIYRMGLPSRKVILIFCSPAPAISDIFASSLRRTAR